MDGDIIAVSKVSGGDTSMAYKIKTSDTYYFVKTNDGSLPKNTYDVEVAGLSVLHNYSPHVPSPCHAIHVVSRSFLLMPWIDTVWATERHFELLGRALAHLHLNSTAKVFGWSQDNYIGSLVQCNGLSSNWVDFYWSCRIAPQIKLSYDNGLIKKSDLVPEDRCTNYLNSIMPEIKPSLLHGDFWSGNYCCDHDTIYLIDPAPYWGHHEVDLAMSSLFGGFSERFYAAYHEVNPRVAGVEERYSLYQLYYLLVHLNMFGLSYYPSVIKILSKIK